MDQTKRKAPKTAFKPGQSGNPTGRPKEVAHVKELAKTYTEEAIRTLAEIMGDGSAPHSARVKASESLLDRAWGKSESTVNVKTPNNVRELSTAEILAALASSGIAGAEGSSDQSSQIH
jgi:hypothetical protein